MRAKVPRNWQHQGAMRWGKIGWSYRVCICVGRRALIHSAYQRGIFPGKWTETVKYTYRNQRDVWVTLVWCCRPPDTRGRLEISPTLPRLDSKKAPRASLWQAVINVTTMNSFLYRQKAHHRAGNTHRRPAKLLPRVCNNSYRLICIMVFWEGTFMGWKNVHTGSQFSWGPEMFKSLLTSRKIIIQRHYTSVRALYAYSVSQGNKCIN